MDAEQALYGRPKKSRPKTKTEALREQSFHEVKHNPPVRVYETERKFGKKRAQAQKTAIALDKVRKKGGRIPKP